MTLIRSLRAVLATVLAVSLMIGCADDDDTRDDSVGREGISGPNFPTAPSPFPGPSPSPTPGVNPLPSPSPFPMPTATPAPEPTPASSPVQGPGPIVTPKPSPTPVPPVSPTPGQTQSGWKKIEYRENSDLLGPAFCDQPYKFVVYSSGRYEAEKCVWRDADNIDLGQKYQGQLGPSELQAIDREVVELMREIESYQQSCDPSANIVTKVDLDLWSNNDRKYRIWRTTEENELCTLGPLPRVSQLHLQVRQAREVYFPPPTMPAAINPNQ